MEHGEGDAMSFIPSYFTEDREHAIERRTAELMAASESFDPFNPLNLSEALCELSLTGASVCGDLLRAGNHAGAGLVLHTLIEDYWRPLARRDAAVQIDRECQFCFGLGCNRCAEQEAA